MKWLFKSSAVIPPPMGCCSLAFPSEKEGRSRKWLSKHFDVEQEQRMLGWAGAALHSLVKVEQVWSLASSFHLSAAPAAAAVCLRRIKLHGLRNLGLSE